MTTARKRGNRIARGRRTQNARLLSVERLEGRLLLADTTISIAFQYPTLNQNQVGIYSAIRDAEVIVLGTTGGAEGALPHAVPGGYSSAPLYTDNSGGISFQTNGIAAGTTQIEFDIYTDSDPTRPAGEYKVVNPVADAMNPPVYSFPVTLTVPAIQGNAIQFPTQQLTVANYPSVSALAVFDGLTMASVYGDTLAQQTPGGNFVGVTAQYPAAGALGYEGSTPNGALASAVIYVPQNQAYAYERVAHEFGHYMAAAAGFFNANAATPEHDWDADNVGADDGAGGKLSKAQGLAAAMNEGFADYFAVMAANAPENSALNLYGVNGLTYYTIDLLGWGSVYPSL